MLARREFIKFSYLQINDSLNWIMKAMARVKMATEIPPFIDHKPGKLDLYSEARRRQLRVIRLNPITIEN